MPDYQKLYTLLFNAITVALGDMEKHNYSAAKERLIDAQIHSEALYTIQTGGSDNA